MKGNFQYTPALEKKWQYNASSRDELENTPPRKFARLGPRDCLRGRIFQYTPPLGSVLLQPEAYQLHFSALNIFSKNFPPLFCNLQVGYFPRQNPLCA